MGIPRFTYRNEFEQIPSTNLTSDEGWGCCYRCCQGFLCNYFIRVEHGFSNLISKTFETETVFHLFMDTLKAQFSIHNLSLENKNIFGIHPGTWGKPSQIANAISSIMTRHNLSSYVALDCNIEPEALSKKTYPLLLMIPTMCGLDTLDPLLFPFLKHIFTIKENLGIVSGYCGSAYVVDIKDSEEVFYFDPHVVQKAVTKSEQFESFFSQPIQKMEMSQLNPSILLCFECPNEERTKNIIKELTEFPKSPLMYSSQIDDEVINHVLDIDDIELQ